MHFVQLKTSPHFGYNQHAFARVIMCKYPHNRASSVMGFVEVILAVAIQVLMLQLNNVTVLRIS
jgi:hypothetical protein